MVCLKIQWKKLIFALLLPLAVGGLSAFLTRDGMEAFSQLNQPPLSPPAWLFPVAWTILYLLMGYASYRVWTSAPSPIRRTAIRVYLLQLVFNFVWPILFFEYGKLWIALFWLIALWALVASTLIRFRQVDRTAGNLLIPYLIWLTFALYLNAGVAYLN